MSGQKGVMLTLLCTGIETATCGHLNMNNARVRPNEIKNYLLQVGHFVGLSFWHDAFDIYEQL
jgi:hypothetical protein